MPDCHSNRFAELMGLVLTAVLSWFVPKKKGTVAFVAAQYKGRFSGNVKYLFKELSSIKAQDCFWVCPGKSTQELVKKQGGKTKLNRIFWLLAMNRAQYVVIDCVRSPLALGRYRFVQLWHGAGLKNIGTENPNRTSLGRLLIKLFAAKTMFIIASSEKDAGRKFSSLGVREVLITGSPKNDVFFGNNSDYEQKKRQFQVLGFREVILYAPTYRDKNLPFNPFSQETWESIQLLMEQKDSVFLVKKHPSDNRLEVPGHLSRIRDVSALTEDVQELLLVTDLLITDYSGIVTDFVITGRPVLFYIFDYDLYKNKCRSFYYQFPDILPGPLTRDESELVTLLSSRKWFNDLNYKNKYTEFLDIFHKYQDGQATKRVTKEFTRRVR